MGYWFGYWESCWMNGLLDGFKAGYDGTDDGFVVGGLLDDNGILLCQTIKSVRYDTTDTSPSGSAHVITSVITFHAKQRRPASGQSVRPCAASFPQGLCSLCPSSYKPPCLSSP
jgi:hypothetical protein